MFFAAAIVGTVIWVAWAWHQGPGSGAPPRPVRDATSNAWYVADSCTWAAEDRRNCQTVLTFLAAFDLGRVNVACRQLSGRYLAQRNIGGLEGCASYLRRHGANRRIDYSIISSRTRPDGGEVVYSITRRAAETSSAGTSPSPSSSTASRRSTR